MFLVFHGRGWLVPVTGIAAIVAADLAGLHAPQQVWGCFALSGLVDRYLGNRWNRAEGRLLQDLHTGEVVEHRTVHTFFSVRMEHWLWVKAGLVLIVLIVLLRHAA